MDFSKRYHPSTQETLVGLYAKRDPQTGLPVEDLNGIIWRVARAVAIAEIKYEMAPEAIIDLSLEQALNTKAVIHWTEIFANHIGNQHFWANTPANINADPNISLAVLKYWAHGKLAGLSEDDIWLRSEELRSASIKRTTASLSSHEAAMGQIANTISGKGCLAACGVAYVQDSLEGIQEAARIEALAAKAAMGMGINTSTLRPWSSVIANGAAASGPDRFYQKSIAQAVEAVAQGGRRGGALIELRNSDHPDILIFIEKKRLSAAPKLAQIFKELLDQEPQKAQEQTSEFKARILAMAEQNFGEQYAAYLEKQHYLKNTNITVLAMPGFMEAVEAKRFYPAKFNGSFWAGTLYDPRRPLIDEMTRQIKINPLTKEPVYQEYGVDTNIFPEVMASALSQPELTIEKTGDMVRARGHFYAPDVFKRIIEGMSNSGEPGLAFYDHVNAANANGHIYKLNTCNPCGEQFLPAGLGMDGRFYMGTCNLSSMHAAHSDFWKADGSYDMAYMIKIASDQQRFMDNVTDVSWYPIPAQNLTARLERRNGGGFAGIAEYLARLGLTFGSPAALKAVEELFSKYTEAAFEASKKLAEQRGVYPLWTGSQYEKQGERVRNTCMVNNAPTGTLAQALQTSWGIDPYDGIVFSRQVRSRRVDFVAAGFEDAMQKAQAWPKTEEEQDNLKQQIRNNHKSCQGLGQVPSSVQASFPIRREIEPESYIRHLAAIHAGASAHPYAFNSVSNTCSIAVNQSQEVIYDAVFLAWKLKVKDITFYPDGSRISQPVETITNISDESSDDLISLLGNSGNPSSLTSPVNACTKCGGSQWLKIDGCLVCQLCDFSLCG